MQESAQASIEEFRYPSSGAPEPSLWHDLPRIGTGATAVEKTAPASQKNVPNAGSAEGNDSTRSRSEANQREFKAARAQGIEEGRQLERAEQGVKLRELEKRRIETTAQLAQQIADERDIFLSAVEPEIVKLALSIASRILLHEAQMDPLFLAGAVRVALGQLAESVSVSLRVPAADFSLWSETIAHLPNLKIRPTVIADKELNLGDCVIETDMGNVDLGVGSQLKEIARGFFDGAPAGAVQKPSSSPREKGS